MDKIMRLQGTVFSGFGEGKYFTQLDWVVGQFETKLGFAPYPGTLNLEITKDDLTSLVRWLGPNPGVVIAPESAAYCSAFCYPVRINDLVAGAIVVPEITKHPKEKLEVIAPVNIRQTLNISDGDRVVLTLQK